MIEFYLLMGLLVIILGLFVLMAFWPLIEYWLIERKVKASSQKESDVSSKEENK